MTKLEYAAVGCAVGCTVPVLLAIPSWLQGLASRKWPTTKGRILVSQNFSVVMPGGRDLPDVRYEYHVAGTRYEGRAIRFSFTPVERSDKALLRYPVGVEVTVYYNPRRHAQAVLEAGVRRKDVLMVLFPFVYIPAMGLVVWAVGSLLR